MTAIRAALAQSTSQSTGFTRFYPIPTLPPNTTLLFRPVAPQQTEADALILPWAEGREYTFTLNGMVNSETDTLNPVTVRVPCVAQWGLNCPILADLKPRWDGSDADKAYARRFYPRKSYAMFAFIVSSPLVEKTTPENPIRPLRLGPQAWKPFHSGLMSDDFEFVPWSEQRGRDFALTVSLQGGFRHYDGKWRFKETPWTTAQHEARKKYGAPDLTDLLGPVPDAATQSLIWDLYQDSAAGRPFDNAKYGHAFRAFAERPTKANGAAAPVEQPSAENVAAAQAQLAELRARNTTVQPTD